MRYYGTKYFGIMSLSRSETMANQSGYSLPKSYSNNMFAARADIVYVCEGSGPMTVVECQTNSDLIGFAYEPGSAYMPENVFGNNIVKLQSSNIAPVLTTVMLTPPSLQSNSYLANVSTVTVDGSYAIPPNTYAVVVEGTITVSNTLVDSNTDLYILGVREEERTVEGNGKLITFKVV